MTTSILQIDGMSCSHCLNAVQRALGTLPGLVVESVRIGQAVVRHDPATTPATAIVQAIADAGFTATPV